MSDTLYCYHCGRPHPKSEMRRIHNKSGSRWRCIKSIQAAKRSVAERDAYGKRVSAMNAEERSASALATHHMSDRLRNGT